MDLWFYCVIMYSCLKYCIFTKLSQIVCLIDVHILVCQHAKCDWWLWKVLWFNWIFWVFSYIILSFMTANYETRFDFIAFLGISIHCRDRLSLMYDVLYLHQNFTNCVSSHDSLNSWWKQWKINNYKYSIIMLYYALSVLCLYSLYIVLPTWQKNSVENQ